MAKLTRVGTEAAVKRGVPRTIGGGQRLYLRITAPGRAKWLYRYTVAGKSHEMGLGRFGYDAGGVTIAEAYDLAQQAARDLKTKLDPIEQRRARRKPQTPAPTFAEVAEVFIKAHRKSWRSASHASQWAATLATYAFPVIGKVSVAAVTTDHMKAILKPLWDAGKVETGGRVRGRIESVLDYAEASGWRPETKNPARWKGHLANLLPARSKVQPVQHHPALPWEELPAFMAELVALDGIPPLALRLLILTAARSGEMRGARWPEVDMTSCVWTVPGARMKAGREHKVPLSGPAMDVLRAAGALRIEGGLVFPSSAYVRQRQMTSGTLGAILRRLGREDIVTHGFRACFRSWCADNGKPDALAEISLGHIQGDRVAQAYQRSDLLARRRELMEQWGGFCMGLPEPSE